MNWLDTLFGGGGLLVGGGLMGFVKKSLGRMLKELIVTAIATLKKEVLDGLQSELTDLKVKFAAETGGNSNGLRQKLNEVAEDVAHLKGKVGD